MRSRTIIVACLLAAALTVGVAPAHAADVNDGGCRPTKARPTPVILLHGTFADPREIWGAIAPKLLDDGFCVFTIDYGDRGTASIPASATEVARFTKRVLRRTGARKVSFVGHAQGGMLARYVARFRGLRTAINDIVALAPPSHGTTTPLIPPAEGIACRACVDLASGSGTMQVLAAGDEAPPPIAYTVVSTTHDDVITPYTSQALRGSAEITNVVLQDRCPQDPADHASIVADTAAYQWVHSALVRRGPADPALQPSCPAPPPPVAAQPYALGPYVLGSQTRRPRVLLGRSVVLRGGRLLLSLGCEGAAFLSCVTQVEVSMGGAPLASGRVVVRAGHIKAARLELVRTLRPGSRVRLSLRATTQNGAPAVTGRAYYATARS